MKKFTPIEFKDLAQDMMVNVTVKSVEGNPTPGDVTGKVIRLCETDFDLETKAAEGETPSEKVTVLKEETVALKKETEETEEIGAAVAEAPAVVPVPVPEPVPEVDQPVVLVPPPELPRLVTEDLFSLPLPPVFTPPPEPVIPVLERKDPEHFADLAEDQQKKLLELRKVSEMNAYHFVRDEVVGRNGNSQVVWLIVDEARDELKKGEQGGATVVGVPVPEPVPVLPPPPPEFSPVVPIPLPDLDPPVPETERAVVADDGEIRDPEPPPAHDPLAPPVLTMDPRKHKPAAVAILVTLAVVCIIALAALFWPKGDNEPAAPVNKPAAALVAPAQAPEPKPMTVDVEYATNWCKHEFRGYLTDKECEEAVRNHTR